MDDIMEKYHSKYSIDELNTKMPLQISYLELLRYLQAAP